MEERFDNQRKIDGGRRASDSCQGTDCPQFLRQENAIVRIQSKMVIIIALLLATLAFHGFTFRQLLSFVDKYTANQIAQKEVYGAHLVEMSILKGRIDTLDTRCDDRHETSMQGIQKNYDDFHEHMDQFHRQDR